MNFRLDIYTWPAMCGVNPCIRSSDHQTLKGAVAHLDIQVVPYYHAVLLRQSGKGWVPCGWNGEPVGNQKWPTKKGTNGDHPDYLALMADWQNLVSLVRKTHNAIGGGTMDIANELLQERHPGVCGWAYNLGWEAAG